MKVIKEERNKQMINTAYTDLRYIVKWKKPDTKEYVSEFYLHEILEFYMYILIDM